MSVASSGGGGAGIFSYFISVHRAFKPPYLRRNVRKVINHLKIMGTTASALVSPRRQPRVNDESDEEDVRPAKRRRIRRAYEDEAISTDDQAEPRQPFGQLTNDRAQKSLGVKPTEFYGKARLSAAALARPPKTALSSRKSPRKRALEKILPKDPLVFKAALRVDLHSIGPIEEQTEDSWLPITGTGRTADVKCRCTITLSYEDDEDSPADSNRKKTYTDISRMAKMGVLRVSSTEGKVSRELVFSEPHIFSSHEIMINRKKRLTSMGEGSKQCHYSFGLAERYHVQVLLEPVGYQREWPTIPILEHPPDSLNPGLAGAIAKMDISRNDWHFACDADPFEKFRGCQEHDLSIGRKKSFKPIPYRLKMDIRWSLPNQLCASLPYRMTKAEPPVALSLTADVEAIPTSPKAKIIDMSEALLDSPSRRAQRKRNNITTYNLKTLSLQAQGLSPRARKTHDLRFERIHSNSASIGEKPLEDHEGLMVTYAFGRADAAEHLIKQQTVVPSLTCPFCMCVYRILDDLRLHLKTEHSSFKFHLRRASSTRVTFFVEFLQQPSTPGRDEKARTLQLTKPTSLFDLEKYLNGDHAWAKAREGRLHNHWPEHLQPLVQPVESSSSVSPHNSRHSSPNTSHGPDEMDLDHIEREIPKPSKPEKVFLVPKTAKPLYDRITKRVLQPGEVIPSSDSEKDESWLLQRQRDVILDYGDVSNDEKDYIIRWNAFMLEERLTCETYLPQACVRFARRNADEGWFARKRSRKREFALHLETFVMRGVLEEKCLKECVAILRKAARGGKEATASAEDEVGECAAAPRQRGLLDCVCCELAQPPDRVICKGAECPGRFFHRECAAKEGRPVTASWRCGACIS